MAQNNLTSKSENYEDMLIYIAELYYLKGLSQQQIADLTHQSRTNISRLLKICVEKGIVEFTNIRFKKSNRRSKRWNRWTIKKKSSHRSGGISKKYFKRRYFNRNKLGFDCIRNRQKLQCKSQIQYRCNTVIRRCKLKITWCRWSTYTSIFCI